MLLSSLLAVLIPVGAHAANVSAGTRINASGGPAPVVRVQALCLPSPVLSASPRLEVAPVLPSAPLAAPLPQVSALAAVPPAAVLEGALPRMFDNAAPAPEPDAVRSDYGRFLSEVGFRDYPAEIASTLEKGGQTELQRKVLEFNARRYRVINAARDLAAEVMSGLSEQGDSPSALDAGTELAARLLSLQPLDPPANLPPEVARRDKQGVRDWLVAVTVQRLSAQLAQVVSDVVRTAIPDSVLKPGLDALERGDKDAPAARELLARVRRIKDSAETILITAYTDAEAGQTRYAGRALAASLVRFARKTGRAEVESDLSRKVSDRGLRLENFVGDTLVLADRGAAGGQTRVKLRTGDFLGERSGGREAAEITFGVRPTAAMWFKAQRARLLGHPLGLWANPKERPVLKPGQPVRNRLKQLLAGFREWLAGRRFLENGYSHVGMASLEESDGVVMAWALDNYPNTGEGGIRKIGIAEEFAQQGPFLKLGVARLDADRVWDAFHAQAAKTGYQEGVYRSGADLWPSVIGREDYAALLAIPRRDSDRLLSELTLRAASTIEGMLSRLGVGFALGFVNEVWRAYCSSTMVLAFRMGAQFEVQDRLDHWHPLVLAMKRLGVPGVKDQRTEGRIIWPGSLFIEPKIARHQAVEFPPLRRVGKVSSPYTMPAYLEMDHALTLRLQSLSRVSDEAAITPDAELIGGQIHRYLDSSAQKSRAKNGSFSSGASTERGYSAGLEQLLREIGGE